MIRENPSLFLHEPITEDSVTCQSPSNLAIVKYWGKYGIQYPKNPSLSLTLQNSYTETTIAYKSKNNQGLSTTFLFESESKPHFKRRVDQFLTSILSYFPFLSQLHLDIASRNSFPHSSGIASSASSMSALALCLCEIEKRLFGSLSNESDFYQKASFIARLGSGSACRSVYGRAAIWGQHQAIEGSSNDFAIDWGHQIDKVFYTFHDDILIVSPSEKSVSSSAGHRLMEGNVYSQVRYQQAFDRLEELTKVMEDGELLRFGKITEDEAMTLHALMMCSDPSYMLIEPGSIAIMKAIRSFREDTCLPVFFSLDAGPNIHLLYPEVYQDQVGDLIETKLRIHCHQGRVIKDQVGNGPKITKK